MPTEALLAFGMLKLTSLMFAIAVGTAVARDGTVVCLIAKQSSPPPYIPQSRPMSPKAPLLRYKHTASIVTTPEMQTSAPAGVQDAVCWLRR